MSALADSILSLVAPWTLARLRTGGAVAVEVARTAQGWRATAGAWEDERPMLGALWDEVEKQLAGRE